MAYWLVKTEPSSWSWQDQLNKGISSWDGVRNYQASNNLKAMKIGDLAFFYHSVKEKQIVGIVEVIKEYYPDPTDASGRFGMVDFKTVKTLPYPVTLAQIKSETLLKNLALIKQSRLSVMPINEQAWKIICDKAELP